MMVIPKDFTRKLLVSYALLYVVTLSSCNNVAEIGDHPPQKRTALVDPHTTVIARHPRSQQKPKSVNIAKKDQDSKTSEPKRRNYDLQSSSPATRSTAKSPLVLRLLQEQDPTDISNQLAHSPAPQLHHEPEEETVYYQQAPQENAGDIREYAEPEYGTPTHKEIVSLTCPRYQYVYKVKDPKGNDFGHSESRLNGRTWGQYFVQLPDGRHKTVRYWADSTGFHAKVEYEGPAAHPFAEEERHSRSREQHNQSRVRALV